jgi:hypothetical protein
MIFWSLVRGPGGGAHLGREPFYRRFKTISFIEVLNISLARVMLGLQLIVDPYSVRTKI